MNLIEIQPKLVIVHCWGQQGQGDVRPFFKQHRLARNEIEVVLLDRKREARTVKQGDEFLYGEPLPLPWSPNYWHCLNLYQRKWQRRFVAEDTDWRAAPCSYSNYCWDGVKYRCIPWAALKSAWRHENPPLCVNCDKPTLLVRFGYFSEGCCKREPLVTCICPHCRRQFEDHSHWDGPKWLMENLDEPFLPDWDILYREQVRYTLPWTLEGREYQLNRSSFILSP